MRLELVQLGKCDEMVDRSEAATALAKAIAYKNVGSDAKAEAWARELVRVLECGGILNSDEVTA